MGAIQQQKEKEKKAATAKQKAEEAAAALEAELQAIQRDLQMNTIYGNAGPSEARGDEMVGWLPDVMAQHVGLVGPDGHTERQQVNDWWNRHDPEEKQNIKEQIIAGLEGRAEEEWHESWSSSVEEEAHK